MNQEQWNDLQNGYLDGTLTEAELRRLHGAVCSSKEYLSQFQQATRVHVLLRDTMSEQIEINSIQESVSRPASTPEAGKIRWVGWASAAVLLIAITGVFFYSDAASGEPLSIGVCLSVSGSGDCQLVRSSELSRLFPASHFSTGDRVICGDDAQAMLQLSDGSILSMASGSEVTFVSDLPEVKLNKGEVFFEIAKRGDGMLPFKVHTGQSTVEVLGTVFNIAENGQTKLEVYEGLVTLTRHSDNSRVEVGTHQTTTTSSEVLSVSEISASSRRTIGLFPTDDMTLDCGQHITENDRLKVEGNRRFAFLRFEIPDFVGIESAKLQLTQEIDAGKGTLTCLVGETSDWSESNFTQADAPHSTEIAGQHRGVIVRDQVVEIDVSSAVVTPGPMTFILTLDEKGENDIWFGSREGSHPPRLLLTFRSEDG